MKLRLLASTLERDGSASGRQHYSCFVIDGCVAIDAGSLATSVTSDERNEIRDVVLTHAHLDHIAGLPLFIDDLFPILKKPVRVYATREVIDVLETHIFNWAVYPRFSEIKNSHGEVIEYVEIENSEFYVRHLKLQPVAVNHKVPSTGFIFSDEKSTVAVSGDTAEMGEFWDVVNKIEKLDALLIECAFPDEFEELSSISRHLTPAKLKTEIGKLKHSDCPIYVINLKPSYRDAIVSQLEKLSVSHLQLLEVGREYHF